MTTTLFPLQSTGKSFLLDCVLTLTVLFRLGSFKCAIINCLLNRYFRICPSYDIFHTEILKLKSFFLQNGNPSAFFELTQDFAYTRCLHKIFPSSDSNPTETDNRRTIYFCLPFTGTHSLRIRTQVTKLLASSFPEINLRIIF